MTVFGSGERIRSAKKTLKRRLGQPLTALQGRGWNRSVVEQGGATGNRITDLKKLMIDINKITEEIKLKIQLHDRQDIEAEIDKRIRAGSTGGEILSMVGKYLSDLRKTDKDIYDLIKDEVELFLRDCRSHGINII